MGGGGLQRGIPRRSQSVSRLRGGARRPQNLGERGRAHLRVPPLSWPEAPSACTRGRAWPEPGFAVCEPLGGEAALGVQEADRRGPGGICRRLEPERFCVLSPRVFVDAQAGSRRRTHKSSIQYPGCKSHCCVHPPACCALSHSSSAEIGAAKRSCSLMYSSILESASTTCPMHD